MNRKRTLAKLLAAPIILGIVLAIGRYAANQNGWNDFYQVFLLPALFPIGGLWGQYVFGSTILGMAMFALDLIPRIRQSLFLVVILATILCYLLYWWILMKVFENSGG